MPTYREQIEQTVEALIQEGRIGREMRDQYLNLLSSNERTAEYFASTLSKGQDYTRKTQELAAQRRQQEQELADNSQYLDLKLQILIFINRLSINMESRPFWMPTTIKRVH